MKTCTTAGCGQPLLLRPDVREVCEGCRVRGGPPPPVVVDRVDVVVEERRRVKSFLERLDGDARRRMVAAAPVSSRWLWESVLVEVEDGVV